MFAQANSEHCRHKIFNADWLIDGERAAEEPVRDDPQHARARAGGRAVRVQGQRGGRRGRRRAAGSSRRRAPASTRYARRARASRDEGRDAQPSDRDLAVSRRRDRLGRRDPRRRRDRPRRETEGRAHAASRCRTCDIPGWRAAVGARTAGQAAIASRRALEIMLDGPIGAAASTTSSAGRISRATSARASSRGRTARWRGYHKPIMIAGGLGNIRAAQRREGACPAPARSSIVLGGPAMLIGLGGGAASSHGSGAGERRARLRLRAARQPRDAAPRARKSSTRAGRSATTNPIVVDSRRRRRRPFERACRRSCDHSGCGAHHRSARDPERRARHEPDGDLVQRIAGALHARDRAGATSTRFAAICERERCPFAVIGELTAERRSRRARRALGGDARRRCRWTCCSASRRR